MCITTVNWAGDAVIVVAAFQQCVTIRQLVFSGGRFEKFTVFMVTA